MGMMHILLETEVLEVAKAFLLCLPDPIHYILDVKNIVGLAVSSVSEWHARRVHLCNWCESQMRWPALY